MGGRGTVAGGAGLGEHVSEPDKPLPGPAEQRAVDLLRRDGLAILRFDELIGDRELWARLAEDVRAFASIAEERVRARGEAGSNRVKVKADGRRKVKKSQFILRASAIQGPCQPHELVRYALCDPLLAISNAYLGLQSKLTYVDKWYTVPTPKGAQRTKSQRWHRDHIDPHILKAFTYFSDVDAAAGALEYVRGSALGGPYGHLWASSKAEHYPPEGELERVVPPSACVRADGAVGTIVLCDTGGFHRGGFGRKPRITANFTYVSPAALAESRTERRFETDDAMLTDLSLAGRFALT